MPRFTTHLTGLGFPEGPQARGDSTIVFTDLREQSISEFDIRTGTSRILATVGGAPNGLRTAPDGELYVANNGGLWPTADRENGFSDPQLAGMIQHLAADGNVTASIPPTTSVTSVPAEVSARRPNDLVFAADGRIVFTDPRNWETSPDSSERETGRLYAGMPGSEPSMLAEIDGFPNGLAFLPSGELLVGLSEAHRVVRYRWSDGIQTLEEPTVFAETGVDAPDGIIVVGDRVIVAGSVGDGITILDLEGRLVDRWSTGHGSDPTNLCVAFGRLWITLGYPGELVSCEWPNS